MSQVWMKLNVTVYEKDEQQFVCLLMQEQVDEASEVQIEQRARDFCTKKHLTYQDHDLYTVDRVTRQRTALPHIQD
jgi:hypothetical protein